MKKGINMISLSMAIVIIIIMVSTITISVQKILENSNKTKFVSEIILIRDSINSYKTNTSNYPEKERISLNLTELSSEALIQFSREIVTDNVITLYLIDYDKIGINTKIFGNNKDGLNKDIYAFSKETGQVYYLKGIKFNGRTYYTLTEEISDMKDVIELELNQIKKGDCIFERRDIYNERLAMDTYENNSVDVIIYIPEEAQNIDISYENYDYVTMPNANNVETDKKGFVKYVTQIPAPRNYDVIVSYTLNGIDKVVKFTEDKIDIEKPILDISNIQIINLTANGETTTYLTGYIIEDSLSGIKFKKYELDNVGSSYFSEDRGKEITEDKIDVSGAKYCTMYVEDKSGNVITEVIDLSQ